jgi:hypothetical protein
VIETAEKRGIWPYLYSAAEVDFFVTYIRIKFSQLYHDLKSKPVIDVEYKRIFKNVHFQIYYFWLN